MSTKTYTAATHPFARLGPGPYRVIGCERRVGPVQDANGFSSGAPGQPMGCCDHCGRGIADCYQVKASNGVIFTVGCDCVEKAYAAFNDDREANGQRPMRSILEDSFKMVQRGLDRERRQAKAKRDAEYVRGLLSDPTVTAQWASEPHPHGYHDRKTGEPLTFLDYVTFMERGCGMSGIGKLASFLRKRALAVISRRVVDKSDGAHCFECDTPIADNSRLCDSCLERI